MKMSKFLGAKLYPILGLLGGAVVFLYSLVNPNFNQCYYGTDWPTFLDCAIKSTVPGVAMGLIGAWIVNTSAKKRGRL
jgi:hypothetical protein